MCFFSMVNMHIYIVANVYNSAARSIYLVARINSFSDFEAKKNCFNISNIEPQSPYEFSIDVFPTSVVTNRYLNIVFGCASFNNRP